MALIKKIEIGFFRIPLAVTQHAWRDKGIRVDHRSPS